MGGFSMFDMRIARTDEKPIIIDLWKKIFGDSTSFIEAFYHYCLPSEDTLVLTENGRICSILSIPEISLSFANGQNLKCGYIYALGTDPFAQGRGFASHLMRFGENYLQQQGASYAIVVPAEMSLFQFYCNLGYSTSFYHVQKKITKISSMTLPSNSSLKQIDAGEYNLLRRQLLSGHCYTDYKGSFIELQNFIVTASGGGLYKLSLSNGPGSAVATKREGRVEIVELLCSSKDITQAVALLGSLYSVNQCHLRLPPWLGTHNDLRPHGMARSLRADLSVCSLNQNSYLGFAFD